MVELNHWSLIVLPTGLAWRTFSLYSLICGSRKEGAATLSAITPMPFWAARWYVEGCKAATQMAGCGFWYGLGRTSRGGTCQKRPSHSNRPSSHILGIMLNDSS